MTRAPAGSDMAFDPSTLKMISCWGWSEKDFRDTAEKLDLLVVLADLAANRGGFNELRARPDDARDLHGP